MHTPGRESRNLAHIFSCISVFIAPGEYVWWQLCLVDGGGQLAEVCTREVLKDILHIAVSNERQDPVQEFQGIGAACTAQVAHPESSGEFQDLLDARLQRIPYG